MRYAAALSLLALAACTIDEHGLAATDGTSADAAADGSRTDPPRPDAARDAPEPGRCGDGTIVEPEQCDGVDLGGRDCTALGFAGGELGCSGECALDTSGCTCPDTGCAIEGQERCALTRREVCVARGPCLAWRTDDDCAAAGMACIMEDTHATCLGGDGSSCARPRPLLALPHVEAGSDLVAARGDNHTFTHDSCAPAAGVDAVYVVPLAAGSALRVRERAGVDAVFHVLASCADDAACLASRDEPDDPGLTFVAPADGTYFVVVEARDASPTTRRYDIEVAPAPAGNVCAAPIVADDLPVLSEGSAFFDDFTDDHTFDGEGCLRAEGAEVVVSRAMEAGETVRVREENALDAVIHVLASCEDGAPCLRSVDEPEPPGVTFTAPEGGVYHFVVEARYPVPLSGRYRVSVDDPPPGNLCTDPVVAATLPVARAGSDFHTLLSDDVTFAGEGCSPAAGAELVLSRVMDEGETVRLRELDAIDVVLRVMDGCGPAAPCLVDRGEREGAGLTFTAPSAGRYYFVVESVLPTPLSSRYEVVLDHPPPGNLCSDPVLVGELPFRLTGDDATTRFTDDHEFLGPACAPAAGLELVLAHEMRAGQRVRFADDGAIGLTLRVLSLCAPATAPCLGSSTGGAETLDYTAPADGTYYFVAESTLPTPTSNRYDVSLTAL